MNGFANRLRSDRQQVGMTVRQLADETGISFSYITKIETGRSGSGVSPEIVTTLANALDRDVLEYLFLSDVVPAPLNALLSDENSRTFIRSLLNARLKSTGWERLQNVLADAHGKKPTSRNKNSDSRTKNARRRSVA